MIQNSYILALSQPTFVKHQLRTAWCSGACDARRDNLWRGWVLETR